jgi:hypothetical protein
MPTPREPIPGGATSAASILSVAQGADGVWSVNERGSDAAAVSYFPSKRAAIRHALRAARLRRACLVRVLRGDGEVEVARSYASTPDSR